MFPAYPPTAYQDTTLHPPTSLPRGQTHYMFPAYLPTAHQGTTLYPPTSLPRGQTHYMFPAYLPTAHQGTTLHPPTSLPHGQTCEMDSNEYGIVTTYGYAPRPGPIQPAPYFLPVYNNLLQEQLFREDQALWHQRYRDLRNDCQATLEAQLMESRIEWEKHFEEKDKQINEQTAQIVELKVWSRF